MILRPAGAQECTGFVRLVEAKEENTVLSVPQDDPLNLQNDGFIYFTSVLCASYHPTSLPAKKTVLIFWTPFKTAYSKIKLFNIISTQPF